jgi:hypothetical protein
MYNTQDFDEMEILSTEVAKFFPAEPELAVEHFESSYTHLISSLIVGMVWSYLEAKIILKTGLRMDAYEASRKWRPTDYLKFSDYLKN